MLSFIIIEEDEKKKKKAQKFSFPWWMLIVAWAILWFVTLGSGVIVMFYGIQFGDDKVKKWITSFLISLFTSVFLTQPVKVKYIFMYMLCVSDL